VVKVNTVNLVCVAVEAAKDNTLFSFIELCFFVCLFMFVCGFAFFVWYFFDLAVYYFNIPYV